MILIALLGLPIMTTVMSLWQPPKAYLKYIKSQIYEMNRFFLGANKWLWPGIQHA